MSSGKIYAVVTADIVGSRQIHGFRKKRDEKLHPLSARHLREKLILSGYAVTAWDEFQAILRRPTLLPRVILDLRRHFYPWQLRVAVGLGKVSEPHRRPVNVFAGGEAFERARQAADRLRDTRGSKFRSLTAIESGNAIFDVIGNTMYHLHDVLLQDISAKQWRAIMVQTRTGSQEKTARELGVNVSTVSRTLRRAHYWQLEETRAALEKVIDSYF